MRHGSIVRDENRIPLGAQVLVRVPSSHRKRDRFAGLLNRKIEYWYSFRFTGHFTYVNDEEFDRVKHLVTRPRIDTDKLLKCWG